MLDVGGGNLAFLMRSRSHKDSRPQLRTALRWMLEPPYELAGRVDGNAQTAFARTDQRPPGAHLLGLIQHSHPIRPLARDSIEARARKEESHERHCADRRRRRGR